MTPPIERIEDLELNKYSVQKWKELFYSSGFHVQSLEVNADRNVLLHFASLVQRISFLEEYFSINLFVAMVNS
jgi:hypothetical protein